MAPASASSSILFFFEKRDFTLLQRTRLKFFLRNLFKKEAKRLGCANYIFCSDKRLLEINRQFLNHDYYTDIITFDLTDGSGPVEAEIYISIDRVRENAKSLGVSFKKEIHRVIFHGALHLCGYVDKTNKEKEKMRQTEDLYLSQYFK